MNAVLKPREPHVGPTRRWVSFDVGHQRYAVDIAHVREALSEVNVETVPGAPTLVVGVINLRGRIVSVFDVHRRLGVAPPSGPVSPCCVIVVEVEGEPVALRVDHIAELRVVPDSAIKPPPRVAPGEHAHVVSGVVSRPGDMLTLLDIDTLVDGL